MHFDPKSAAAQAAKKLVVVIPPSGDFMAAVNNAIIREHQIAAQKAKLAENEAKRRPAPTAEDLAQQHQPARVYQTFSVMGMQQQAGTAPDMSEKAVAAREELRAKQLAAQQEKLAQALAEAKKDQLRLAA